MTSCGTDKSSTCLSSLLVITDQSMLEYEKMDDIMPSWMKKYDNL